MKLDENLFEDMSKNYKMIYYMNSAAEARRPETVQDVENDWKEITISADNDLDALKQAFEIIKEADVDYYFDKDEITRDNLLDFFEFQDWGSGAPFLLFLGQPRKKPVFDTGYHSKEDWMGGGYIEDDDDFDDDFDDDDLDDDWYSEFTPKNLISIFKTDDKKLATKAAGIVYDWYDAEGSYGDFDDASDYIDYIKGDLKDVLDASSDNDDAQIVMKAFDSENVVTKKRKQKSHKYLKEDRNVSIQDKLEYLKNYPIYPGYSSNSPAYTRPCKVWDLGLTNEQQEKFFTWLDEGGLDVFWRDNETLSQDIYQDGRMGGHLILNQEILNPKDFVDVTNYNELLDEYLDNNYYPDNDDGTYTDTQKQEAKEEIDSLINDAYDKLTDFDNRVDQLIVNLKDDLDKYEIEDSDDIMENLNESIEEVKSILQPLVTKDGKIRALRNDEKLPRGFKFKSGNDTSGEVTYKGTDYAYALVDGKLKVMTSAKAGDNWSETIYKESFNQSDIDFIFSSKDEKYPYMMLSRLKSDCDYYLGAGNKADKHLWALNPKDQIAYMRAIYDRLEEKPEWLTSEQIDEYEKKMLEEPVEYDSTVKNESFENDDIERCKFEIRIIPNKNKDLDVFNKLTHHMDYLVNVDESNYTFWNVNVNITENLIKVTGIIEGHECQNLEDYIDIEAWPEINSIEVDVYKENIKESFEDEHLGKATDCKPEEISGESAPETPNPGPESGIAGELNKLIIDEWEAIQGYNDAIVAAELEGYSDIASILRDIANEEMNHVGMLETALQTISPNAASIQTGEQEAQEQIAKAE